MRWVVPELGTDFTEDFEIMLLPYIINGYSISNPVKEDIKFRSGFFDFSQSLECCILQQDTVPVEKISQKYTFTTTMEIHLRMLKLDRDAIDSNPQLENMEQEFQRIIENYYYNDIVGIKEIFFDPVSTERVYNASDTWAKSDWRSLVRVKMFYEKENLED